MKNVATRIAELNQQIKNCKDSKNLLWQEKAEEELEYIMKRAPSGSGFDNGTKLERAEAGVLVFRVGFHHMDGNGYYDGWTEHSVWARPTFTGLSINITGRNKNGIKDHIAETFYFWLNQDYVSPAPEQLA